MRQSIVWRSFLRQWPFFLPFTYSWLANSSSSGSQIQTFVTKCSGSQSFSRDKSIVQHACSSPGVHVHGPERVSHNALIIIPQREHPWLPITRQCSPSRLVMVVLLFAQIHGGSKTKQAAPASSGPPWRGTPTAARRWWRTCVEETLRPLKIKK